MTMLEWVAAGLQAGILNSNFYEFHTIVLF